MVQRVNLEILENMEKREIVEYLVIQDPQETWGSKEYQAKLERLDHQASKETLGYQDPKETEGHLDLQVSRVRLVIKESLGLKVLLD
jgi:hypothetical protein